ncbi:hypothetical protein K4F52_004556 [Lecanicillium sp. MT-2017a]|nr:hypothetical protein K4F52_004556 [Lecanicillium sp. MT-2017a]
MEVFGLKSQSLKYSMGGFGSVHMYLTPQELAALQQQQRQQHHTTTASASTTARRRRSSASATATTSTTTANVSANVSAMAAPSPSSKAVLIVGASRGIGHQLVEQLAQQPDYHITASVRSSADFGTAAVNTVQLDQSSADSVRAAAAQVKELDTLIVNAAMGDDEKLLSTSDERMAQYMDVNVTGALRVVKAFLPALRARKTRQIVLVSSTSGSLARQVNVKRGFVGPYAVSKAALNMVAVQLHNELHDDEGFTVVPIHPGWVATDMGSIAGDGGMAPEKSAAGIIGVVQKLKPDDSATFFNYDGTTLPW